MGTVVLKTVLTDKSIYKEVGQYGWRIHGSVHSVSDTRGDPVLSSTSPLRRGIQWRASGSLPAEQARVKNSYLEDDDRVDGF